MTKLRILVFAILVLAMGSTLLSLNGCGGTRRKSSATTTAAWKD